MKQPKHAHLRKNQVVSSDDSGRSRSTSRRAQQVIAVVAVVIVCLLAVVAYSIFHTKTDATHTYTQAENTAFYNKVTAEINTGQSKAAIAAIKARTPRDSQIDGLLADTYLNTNDFQAAFNQYVQNGKIYGLTSHTAAGAARAAEYLKQDTTALAYYRQALQLAQKEASGKPQVIGSNQNQAEYQEKITMLMKETK